MLAATCVYFNPCGYQKLLTNYKVFRDNFRGCDLYAAELAFDSHFETSADFRWQASSSNFMWQKEAMINEVVRRLPAKYSSIAWIDCDVIFSNRHWVQEASALLELHPIVQLFETVHQYSDEIDADPLPGFAFCSQQQLSVVGSPGYAWAARREFFQQNGLPTRHILGGGDSLLTLALDQRPALHSPRDASPAMKEWYLEWSEPIRTSRPSVGAVSGTIFHLPHGSICGRKYRERWSILARHNFDPLNDVKLSADGILEWAHANDTLKKDVKRYFFQRYDDN
ncbi:hypothetical protein [Rubinisphaera margarita]|uniref:hypothetical protein n=1 Tax=Rubinisphaera margarita TaxID=2909586 RepID=UPI001EE8F691|nr:hypothetical protein [Rubinisphaera margarita]MCG6154358.1 hypothetical protein [Rubinisphaera margarita]